MTDAFDNDIGPVRTGLREHCFPAPPNIRKLRDVDGGIRAEFACQLKPVLWASDYYHARRARFLTDRERRKPHRARPLDGHDVAPCHRRPLDAMNRGGERAPRPNHRISRKIVRQPEDRSAGALFFFVTTTT